MNQKYMIYMYLLKARTFIALLLVIAFFSVMVPNFLTTSNLLIMTQHVAITGLLAIGMTLVILTGGIDLSVGAVAGIAAFFGVLAAYHVYHEGGYSGSDVIAAHQVIYVVHLSADKGVGSIVFGELPQRVAVEEVVAGCQGKGGECTCYQS